MRPGAGRPGVTPSSTHRRLCDTADDARGRTRAPSRVRAAGAGARDRATLATEQARNPPKTMLNGFLTIGSVRHPNIRRVTQAAERGRPQREPVAAAEAPERRPAVPPEPCCVYSPRPPSAEAHLAMSIGVPC